jgi:magnesium transporter
MIRSLYFSKDDQLKTSLSLIDIAFGLQDLQGLLWVDFEATDPGEAEPILRKTFGFHPLAIDDALQETHIPKLDDWGKYLYLVLNAITYDKKDGGHINTMELDVFLGSNYVVTHHDTPIDVIERVWASAQRDVRQLKSGADHLLYRILDEMATSYMPIVEQLDGEIDQVEAEVFDQPSPSTVERIFSLKRSVLYLRRVIAPLREVLNKLARDDFDVVDEKARIYYRDVYDHLVRLYDITEGVRDLVSGTLDTYLSVVNNRMNDIMKTLTIITTLFMPISFIASFFGMNFFQPAVPLNVWTRLPAFMITLILVVITPAGMFLWIRKRGWM